MREFTVERTWTYRTTVLAETAAEARSHVTLEDTFMEAYTQGDGAVHDEVIEETPVAR